MYYNTAMKTINVAVIGLGYWGPNLVRNFSKIPGVQVIYGCDLIEKNLQNTAVSFPFIKPTNDYRNVLQDPRIDLIAIATPVSTHYALAKDALLAGKHVLIEKPMTRTSEEGKDLIKIATKSSRMIFVDHTFVYSAAVQKIKEILSKNRLGDVYYYDSTRINLGLLQSDINVIWDLAPHDFSILRYLFDATPVTLRAFGSSHVQKKHIEMAHIMITYKNLITAHIHLSWLSPVKIRTVLIGGSKKMIVYNDIEPSEKIRVYDKGILVPPSTITPFAPAYRSGSVLIPHLEQEEALYTELMHVIDCLRFHKRPLTDGQNGLTVVKLLEASDRSIRENAEVAV